ncbi:hypothetical protein L6452_32387 [Arctium lappa]|uniref:Uncharacterized protein n=1 Tax=Arctium lappa TaxID=4217 RepID=A0ACB8Z4D5_ARCLA|nr:hypothetical protein L6452_32387 [Arctium lappa]
MWHNGYIHVSNGPHSCQQNFEDILSITDNIKYYNIRKKCNSRWVHAMPWSGQKDFVAASNVSFLVDGKEDGILKNHGIVTFIKVHDVGHMVHMDQPRALLYMLELWTTGKLIPPKKGAIAPL